MNEPIQKYAAEHDEIRIEEIVARIWRRKWLVLLLALMFAVVAGTTAFLVPKSYLATTVVAPVLGNNNGGALSGLNAMVSQFGGLASLAGVSVSGDSRKYESLAVLQSEALTERYISTNNLLPILYADEWDVTRNAWKSADPSSHPTLWKANRDFKKIRTVSTDSKTGLITISITWTDPKLAAAWANDFVKLTNEYLRNKAITEADGNMAYLNEQAAKTEVVAVKQGIYTMIQIEINKAMTAKGTTEFALKVLDPAVAPEKPSAPRKAIWTLAGFFGGILFSSGLAVFLETRQRTLIRNSRS
jgi:uncharacterized protein involved in exopolysaccharide biosynthesis